MLKQIDFLSVQGTWGQEGGWEDLQEWGAIRIENPTGECTGTAKAPSGPPYTVERSKSARAVVDTSLRQV